MNGKITQNEFKKWSQELRQIYTELLSSSSGLSFEGKKFEEEFIKIGAITNFYIGEGVIQAALLGMLHLEEVGLKNNVPLKALGGLTFKEWEEKVWNRIKEHCIANGYYNPNSPPDLTLLKQRRNKVNKLLKDNKELTKLLAYADSEEYKLISNTVLFLNQLREIMPGASEEGDEIPQAIDFFVEDLVGRAEKLISKKEQDEKMNKPSSPSSNSPVSKPPSTEYKNNLEEQINELQTQINELESSINNTTDATQKETYQKILAGTKKDLETKEKEKDKLDDNRKNSESSNKSNGKLNLAIGLGIGAIVIGLICLIFLVTRSKER